MDKTSLYSVAEVGIHIVKPPERSDWNCYFDGAPGDPYTTSWRPHKGREPNRFHRWMQALAFGVKWVCEPLPGRKDTSS